MSRIIAQAAIRGAHQYVARAERELHEAMESYGAQKNIGFPNTAYYLPLILAVTGIEVKTLSDANKSLEIAKSLVPPIPEDQLWLPYLGSALDAGVATLIAQEILEALKYLRGEEPKGIWLGFTDDAILRTQGIKLVDGRMPGFAACVGALPTVEEAVALARSLQERNILVFMASHTNGVSMAEQLAEAGIEMNWDTFLVPYGKDTSAAVHALNFAARAAMTFGGIKPGDLEAARKIFLYNKERVHAFVLALGADYPPGEDLQLLTDEKYATAAGAINFGFPTISDVPLPQILPRGICTYEHVVSGVPREQLVSKACEVRGLKIKLTKIPIPVPYGAGFEGERVRKENLYVEFGGKSSPSFELLQVRPMAEVDDERIEIVGPDLDAAQEGGAMPLGVVVEAAGRNLKEDFEPVLERRIHHFVSCINGVMHIGQRDITWVRISKEAFQKGFRLKHYGQVLLSKFKEDFGALVDKVQVTILTDPGEVERRLAQAREVYRRRDERVLGMTDEDVDLFYSCTLCQSYAPNHVCVVAPERLGLCGAYTWLDCAASHEIDPHGPNQPIKKGETLDPILGQWHGVNEFVQRASRGNVERISMYSILQDPQTSCGCFECIVAIVPEANGVMIVNREYLGETPIGMTFSTLAGQIGGGVQMPGFLGVGKLYITSKKFISAEGGIKRVVWMPKELREEIRPRLEARLSEIGEPDLLEKIATDEEAKTLDELLAFLERVGHPALSMEPLL